MRDLGEVFTPAHIVDQMLDQPGIRDACRDLTARFLEPACGNGNFLEGILSRKLDAVDTGRRIHQETFEARVVLAVTSVYGVDISQSNVNEARERIFNLVIAKYSGLRGSWKRSPAFDATVRAVLRHTIVLGDMLNGRKHTYFVEFAPTRIRREADIKHFRLSMHSAASLLDEALSPTLGAEQLSLLAGDTPDGSAAPPVHFLELPEALRVFDSARQHPVILRTAAT